MSETTATQPPDRTTTWPAELHADGSGVGTASGRRYLRPDWVTSHVMNPIVAGLVKLGFSVRGARQLEVRGRTSGTWRTTPVNVLELDGHRYLVAPRGHTQWVRNLRVAGGGRLRRGRRVEEFAAIELADEVKPVIIREYLRLWAFEVGRFFDGITVDSSDDDLLAAAPGFPVFELTT
jgi:deazaflavin-dependent oxidoreductase (nitroreductase family)